MKKFHLTHKVFTASIAGVVTVATSVVATLAYQSLTQYKPSSSKEIMKNNQVLFDNKSSLSKSNKGQQDSKWLEKQDEKNSQDSTQNSSYLFGNDQNLTVQKAMSVNTQTTNTNNAGASADTVLDVDKNATDSDIIIDENTSGGKNDSQGTKSDGTNNGGHNSNSSSTKVNYNKIKDPEVNKSDSNSQYAGSIDLDTDTFTDSKVEQIKKNDKYTMNIMIMPTNSQENLLYQGSTITKTDIYNRLITGVVFTYGTNENGDRDTSKDIFYTWDEDALDKYIRINGISVDNGQTWIKDFPYTIPSGVDRIKLDISYRLNEKDKWISYDSDNPFYTTMDVSQTKVVVLNKKLNEKSEQINVSDIVNISSQYYDTSTVISLLAFQNSILVENQYLTSLFPGWMENGKAVGWEYTVDSGRHFLEPMDVVKLDDKYSAKLFAGFETVFGKERFCYLQSLVNSEETDVLHVPKYIQMVKLEETKMYDSIELPDSVMVVHDGNISVKDTWIVSENNPYLTVKNNILMSKDLTDIISVPENTKDVVVNKKVTKISAENLDGKTIYLKAKNIDALPDITYSNLKNCKIVLKDAVFDEYISNNYNSILNAENITFAKASNEDKEYTVKNHCIICGNTLYKTISGVSTIHLDDNIDTIQKNAFKNVEGIQNLILNDSNVTLEKGCFDESSIKYIYCGTNEQLEYVKKCLEELGYTDIQVSLMENEINGFKYKIDEDGVVTLLKAPSSVVEFNGALKDVQFDVIGDGAFKNCMNLKKVYLPESVKEIGEEAFENCSNLELLLIDSRDTIDIGMDAFEGLSSIRLLASNAQYAQMNGYMPNVVNKFNENVFFVPSYNAGYNNCIYFIGGYGAYTYENIGANTQAVYLNTWSGTPFLLMASERNVDTNLMVLDTTTEFYPHAMADTTSVSGAYTINLDSIQSVYYNMGAFYNADISKDITIGIGSYIDERAFEYCQYIESVHILDSVTIKQSAFSNCDNIEKISMTSAYQLESYAFSWCVGLQEIEFVDAMPDMKLFENGLVFRFIGDDSNVHITLTNTSLSKEDFIHQYVLLFAGYVDQDGKSATQNLWEEIEFELMWLHWGVDGYTPSYDDILTSFKDTLLPVENSLRRMLGLESVTEPWLPDDLPKKEENEDTTSDIKDSSETIEEPENSKEEEINPDDDPSQDTNSSIEDSDADATIQPEKESDTTQLQDVQENGEDFQ